MSDSNFITGESDSGFLTGEIVTTPNITQNGNLAPISRETTAAQRDAVVHVPREVDYGIVHLTTPEEFLPPIGQWAIVGGVISMVIFASAIGLTTVLKYKVTVQAAATIRPVGEQRLVQSRIEGSVLSIAVRENQTVQQGDPIATVRDLQLESKLQTKRSQLTGDIQKGIQQIAGIDAQIIALARQGVGEKEQSDRAISGIQSELSRAERDYRDKQIVSQAEVAEAEANIRTAEKDRQVAEAELLVANANLRSIQAAHASAVAKRDRYQSASKAGAIAQNQREEAELAAEQQAQAIVAQQATITKQQQTIARLQNVVVSTQARLARTQAAVNPSRADIEQIKHKIEREQANGRTTIARFQQEREKPLQQRVEIVNQIASHHKEIAQIATELKAIPILAPIAGTIQGLNLRNTAQVVHPGDRLAQIIPTGTPLNIKAFVSIADISNVKVGQKVQMRVSACPYTDRGVLPGKVTEISADAKSSDQNAGSNNATQQSQTAANGFYEITVKPDVLTLGTGSNQCQIRSGMEGRADIISKEESVFQFMLSKARLLVNP
jgi:multidrug efflux pump subunit AcrA (membrane-fusion protein)